MKNISFILILFLTSVASSQTIITWKDLDCEFEEVWNEDFNAVYVMPVFQQNQLDIDGELIRIKGFVTTVDVINGYYVFAPNVVSLGSGCLPGFSEIHIMELSFINSPRTIDFTKCFWIEGTLHLNKDDILHLNYILKDAKIIREIKN